MLRRQSGELLSSTDDKHTRLASIHFSSTLQTIWKVVFISLGLIQDLPLLYQSLSLSLSFCLYLDVLCGVLQQRLLLRLLLLVLLSKKCEVRTIKRNKKGEPQFKHGKKTTQKEKRDTLSCFNAIIGLVKTWWFVSIDI